ncbi:unnamed protein product [Ascophyllum nodosum]
MHAPAISRRSSSCRTSGLGAVAAVTTVLYSSSGLTSCGAGAFVLSPCAPHRDCGLTSVSRDCSAPKAHDSDGLACAGAPARSSRSRACRVRGVLRLRSSRDEDIEGLDSTAGKDPSILDVPLELFDEDRVESLRPGSERREMPVFMLDVAACPGGVVPLHIFEMRYRQMFNDIGAKDNRFGMLVSDPTTGRPCKYGTVLECAQRKLLPDGRQYVLNQAVERFRLLKVVKSTPYTVMDVEVGIPDDKPAEEEPTKWGADEGTRLGDLELQASALPRQLIRLVFTTVNSVVELMNKLSPSSDPSENRTLSEWFLRYSPKAKNGVFGGAGEAGEAGASDVLQAQEDERRMKFSYAVAEMIAMPPHTKQLLLQSRSTAYRLMAEKEILVKAQKELAARSSLKDTLG